jgi:hypothetical protein
LFSDISSASLFDILAFGITAILTYDI